MLTDRCLESALSEFFVNPSSIFSPPGCGVVISSPKATGMPRDSSPGSSVDAMNGEFITPYVGTPPSSLVSSTFLSPGGFSSADDWDYVPNRDAGMRQIVRGDFSPSPSSLEDSGAMHDCEFLEYGNMNEAESELTTRNLMGEDVVKEESEDSLLSAFDLLGTSTESACSSYIPTNHFDALMMKEFNGHAVGSNETMFLIDGVNLYEEEVEEKAITKKCTSKKNQKVQQSFAPEYLGCEPSPELAAQLAAMRGPRRPHAHSFSKSSTGSAASPLPFKCEKCDMSFDKKWRLHHHTVNVHEKRRPFPCCSCSKEFRSPYDLSRHHTTHTGQRFACDACGVSFGSKQRVAMHIKSSPRCWLL